jgi:hypothetical protein
VPDGCPGGGALYCGECPAPSQSTEAPVTVTVAPEPPPAACIATGDRCVSDDQCCEGQCRSRNCGERGQKLCTTACP